MALSLSNLYGYSLLTLLNMGEKDRVDKGENQRPRQRVREGEMEKGNASGNGKSKFTVPMCFLSGRVDFSVVRGVFWLCLKGKSEQRAMGSKSQDPEPRCRLAELLAPINIYA
jgi:hypothetical protein